MDAENKIIMRNLHLEKAHSCLKDAAIASNAGSLSMAANRYYYACFHAVHALFVMHDIYSKTHEGMNTLFGLNIVKTGLFEARFGTFLNKMENLRERADYNVVYQVTDEELQTMHPLVMELISSIEKHLSYTDCAD